MSWYKDLAKVIEKHNGKRNIYRSVNGQNILYLERYYLTRTPYFEQMLHCFHLGDTGPLHDHPSDFYNCILETGYLEHTPEGIFKREVGYKGFKAAEELHKVELLPGTNGNVWTLFTMMKRRRKWGFMTENGWVDAFDYMKRTGTYETNTLPEMYEYGIFPSKIIT